jgi:hypothetical protein
MLHFIIPLPCFPAPKQRLGMDCSLKLVSLSSVIPQHQWAIYFSTHPCGSVPCPQPLHSEIFPNFSLSSDCLLSISCTRCYTFRFFTTMSSPFNLYLSSKTGQDCYCLLNLGMSVALSGLGSFCQFTPFWVYSLTSFTGLCLSSLSHYQRKNLNFTSHFS